MSIAIYKKIALLRSPVQIEDIASSLRMTGYATPVSISSTEFSYISKLISRNGLKNGYECGTAFGISSLAAGLGMKETGGTIITLDSYVEEHFRSSSYDKQDKVYYDSMGHKVATFLHKEFGVDGNVKRVVGCSPSDVGVILIRELSSKLDYVFIDGGHVASQILEDTKAVLPFIDRDRCLLLFHDCHMFDDAMRDFLMEEFGKSVEVVVKRPRGFNLGVIKL